MHDGVGIGVVGIDTKSLRQPRAVGRLDRGETKSPLGALVKTGPAVVLMLVALLTLDNR